MSERILEVITYGGYGAMGLVTFILTLIIITTGKDILGFHEEVWLHIFVPWICMGALLCGGIYGLMVVAEYIING